MSGEIIETAMHYWDVDKFSYPWHKTQPESIRRSFLPEDYKDAVSAHNVSGVIVVAAGCEKGSTLAEAEWFSELAAEERRIRGIVSRISFEKGKAAAPELERLAVLPLVKGVRAHLQAEPDVGFCLTGGFIDAVRLLKNYGYVMELTLDERHYENANRFFDILNGAVPCVISHVGNPDSDGDFELWAKRFERLAEYDNVYCKISSLPSIAKNMKNKLEAARPYVKFALKRFGAERAMFGSDWPYIRKSSSFDECVAMTRELAASAGCGEAELGSLFSDTARRVYGI